MDLIEKKIISQYGSKAAYCDSVNISPQAYENKMTTFNNKMLWIGKFLDSLGLEVNVKEKLNKHEISKKMDILIIYRNIYIDMAAYNKDVLCISLKDIKMYYGNGLNWRISYIKANIIRDLKSPYMYGRYSTWGAETNALCDKKGLYFSIKKSDLETVLKLK